MGDNGILRHFAHFVERHFLLTLMREEKKDCWPGPLCAWVPPASRVLLAAERRALEVPGGSAKPGSECGCDLELEAVRNYLTRFY